MNSTNFIHYASADKPIGFSQNTTVKSARKLSATIRLPKSSFFSPTKKSFVVEHELQGAGLGKQKCIFWRHMTVKCMF